MTAANKNAGSWDIGCRGCYFLIIGKRWNGVEVITFYDCSRNRLEVPRGCNERMDNKILEFHR